MPSQADEEAHQLSYLQKHLANILSLLAEPVEGEGEESLVCIANSYFIKVCFSLYLGGPLNLEFYKGSDNLLELVSDDNHN